MYPKHWKQQYSSLPASDDLLNSELPKKRNFWQKRWVFSALTTIALITVFFVTSGLLQWRAGKLTRGKQHAAFQGSGQCGNSTKEALSLGCSFDQLTWAWLPPHCPHYANYEYLETAKWTFYTDAANLTEVQPDEWPLVLDNDLRVYGQVHEHSVHCVYMFVNFARAMREGGKAIPKQMDHPHLQHCADLLIKVSLKQEGATKVGTIAPDVLYDQTC